MQADLNKIGILGCGWLGLPLAKVLLENGCQVKGTTTTEQKLALLKAAGIDPFLIRVLPKEIMGATTAFLEDVSTLIVDFPPGIRNQSTEEYINSMKLLIKALRSSSVKKLLFVSSISVYDDDESFPRYTEDDRANATSGRGRALIEVEELLKAERSFELTILRLGGLIGPGRHPVNQLSGRAGIANADAPINLIHQEDCIGIILSILTRNTFRATFNAVYPLHPPKEQYYRKKAKEKKLPLPDFAKGPSRGKIIESVNVQELLQYKFRRDI